MARPLTLGPISAQTRVLLTPSPKGAKCVTIHDRDGAARAYNMAEGTKSRSLTNLMKMIDGPLNPAHPQFYDILTNSGQFLVDFWTPHLDDPDDWSYAKKVLFLDY